MFMVGSASQLVMEVISAISISCLKRCHRSVVARRRQYGVSSLRVLPALEVLRFRRDHVLRTVRFG